MTFKTAYHLDAASLARLSTLTRLTSLYLDYEGHALIAAARASAWPHLPIRHLWIRPDDGNDTSDRQLPSAAVQYMACLTQLTYLNLDGLCLVETTCEEFAVALRQLTALRCYF